MELLNEVTLLKRQFRIANHSKSVKKKISQAIMLTLYTSTTQNGQTHPDKLFECVWPFCEVGTYRVKN